MPRIAHGTSARPTSKRGQLLRALADANLAAAEAARQLADLEDRATGDEYYDQLTSPLGKLAHLRAVAAGKLPGRRVGKKILVRREDMHAFIETAAPRSKPVSVPKARSAADVLRAELGLEGGGR